MSEKMFMNMGSLSKMGKFMNENCNLSIFIQFHPIWYNMIQLYPPCYKLIHNCPKNTNNKVTRRTLAVIRGQKVSSSKCELISKCLLGVMVWTKIPTMTPKRHFEINWPLVLLPTFAKQELESNAENFYISPGSK